MQDVHIIAVGMIPFGKYPEKSVKDLTAMVMRNLLEHSPVSQDDIEAAWFANAGWGMSTGQHSIRAVATDLADRVSVDEVEITVEE